MRDGALAEAWRFACPCIVRGTPGSTPGRVGPAANFGHNDPRDTYGGIVQEGPRGQQQGKPKERVTHWRHDSTASRAFDGPYTTRVPRSSLDTQ